MARVTHYIFVDESGDPGVPFRVDLQGNAVPTGASTFYIIAALCVTEQQLHRIGHRFSEIKAQFGYTKEVKSNEVSLPLYRALLGIINEVESNVYYTLIDKNTYKGKFTVAGVRRLHNVFDEYNLVKTVAFAIAENALVDVEVVVDRADRRLLYGKFDSFDTYMHNQAKRCLNAGKSPISHITHVNSTYVNVMQLSDLIGGAIRDAFTGKNAMLMKVLDPRRMTMATGKHLKRRNL